MLSPAEKQAIEEEMRHYANRPSCGLEALKIVQKHRGWVSDEGLADIAEFLRVAPAELESVATFYNLIFRRPVGRHVILACDSVSCWIMGHDRLMQRLTAELGIRPGETTPDGRFTLLPIPCLGACHRAPALMVDDDLHEAVDPEKVGEVLGKYA
ncbi:MAG: NADH-quinone oxidoreductase subunit NuoE [Sulfuricella sp.]|nr:NADH-quinone oxidoreductase subunit NuoE [Sulfuricella sp.]